MSDQKFVRELTLADLLAMFLQQDAEFISLLLQQDETTDETTTEGETDIDIMSLLQQDETADETADETTTEGDDELKEGIKMDDTEIEVIEPTPDMVMEVADDKSEDDDSAEKIILVNIPTDSCGVGFAKDEDPKDTDYWSEHLPRFRKNRFFDPPYDVSKGKFAYEKHGDGERFYRPADDYSDIRKISAKDICMDEYDDRIVRKAFDVPRYRSNDEKSNGVSAKRPYTFFLLDTSGSMIGENSKLALAIVQVAAERTFKEGGVFTLITYCSHLRSSRSENIRTIKEFTDLKELKKTMRKVAFNGGATTIGQNLERVSKGVSLKLPIPFGDMGEKFNVSRELDARKAKIFVLHDGNDRVDASTNISVPIYSVILGVDHEVLRKISARTRGKYLLID